MSITDDQRRKRYRRFQVDQRTKKVFAVAVKERPRPNTPVWFYNNERFGQKT